VAPSQAYYVEGTADDADERRLKEPGQKIRKFGKGKAKEQGALLFNLEEESTS